MTRLPPGSFLRNNRYRIDGFPWGKVASVSPTEPTTPSSTNLLPSKLLALLATWRSIESALGCDDDSLGQVAQHRVRRGCE